LTMTNTSVTREQVWTAFRRTPDVRLRERYHTILLLRDGKRCLAVAQWLYRDEGTIRAWVHALHEAGLHRLDEPPSQVARRDSGQRNGRRSRTLSAGVGLPHELVDHEVGPALHLHPLWHGALPGAGASAAARKET
jgi:hypothetical protein